MRAPPVLVALFLACHPDVGPGIPKPGESGDSPVVQDSPALPDTTDSPTGVDTGPEVVPGDTSATEEVPPFVMEHLPILLVDTGGQSIPDGSKIDASLESILSHDGTFRDLDTAPRSWSGPIGIELHGSSSLGFPKLNYRIETRDEEGGDLDVPLVDLPAESDWILSGPYTDKTYVRDALAYTLGARLAETTGEWQPRFQFSEMILNGHYMGIYLVIERIKTAGNRVDVPEVAASAAEGDLTGGYIWRVDQHRNDGWDTALGTPIDYMEPDADSLTAEQRAYMVAWWDAFEDVLASEGFADPATGYPAWIAVDSWIDHFIVNEVAHNVDAYRLSAYLYKVPDADGGLLHCGPLWDFNLGFGNVDYCDCWEEDGFIIDDLARCDCGEQFPFWWKRLLEDPAFTARLRCRWEELRVGHLSDEALLALVDELVAPLDEAEPRDHDTWGNLGVYVWPNYYVGATYEEEVEWMKGWILERTRWLDLRMPGECGGV